MSGRALVTGVTGQDGSYLAERLLADGWQVHGLVRSPDERVVPGVQVHHGDLASASTFADLLPAVRPDVVFHLAGMSSVATSWAQAGTSAEVTGTSVARLLEACFPGGTGDGPRVVLASSAEVFGAATTSPQDERTPVRPSSPYGAAKAFALHLGGVYRQAGHHVGAAVLYNHESPRRPATFVTRKITSTVAAIVAGTADELRVGNLDARRDWGWAPDHVDAMVRMARAERPDDYVVATGEGHSVREFVAAAFAAAGVTGWEHLVHVDPRFVRPVDAVELVGDASRIRRALGWRPTVEFTEVVARMVRADLALTGQDGTRQGGPG
ncbi:GDP-mannose 4,6-dehydratase [Aquipuribacter sp. MA13-6]|uniref:GDP-mannose 4,6-dehydratase n=1 Tax=unclassified Aquipuribacter TaxID=2635084 RepID=UPI003EE861ED